LKYQIDPGEGVFYGPKIDIKIKDVLGRSWQCTTIQVDFNLPERFDIEYSAEDGGRQRPIMIHRALLGSLERFFGILIEHYAGNFPVWLAPEQVRVLSVTDEANDYARKVFGMLKEAGLRAQLDVSSEKIGKKIRTAESMKVPYMAVVGKVEAEAGQVALRKHKMGDLGKFSLDDMIELVKSQEKEKKLE
jgi:threonyl-tRNA synthetase